MKYSKVELGQIEAVLNKLGGEEGLHQLLAGELEIVPADRVVSKPGKSSHPKLLVPNGYFSAVELKERHDPDAFYKDHSGLYVWPDFRPLVVAVAKPMEAGAKFKKVSRFKLGKDATGEELRLARPKAVWSATDLCAWLAAKLAKQPDGEEGELLNTGWANLSLVEGVNGEVFVVYVRWISGYREWHVDTWLLCDSWYAGSRFASRN